MCFVSVVLNSQREAYSELNLTSGQMGIDDHALIHPGITPFLEGEG